MQQAHLYILNNSNEVLPYIVRHKALVKETNQKMTKNRVLKEHNKTFLYWFKDTSFGDNNALETLRKLADGPKRNVITWQGCDTTSIRSTRNHKITRVQCKTMGLV